MTTCLRALDRKEYESICADPDRVEELLYPLDEDAMPVGIRLFLGEFCHALHFALTGSHDPDGSALSDAVMGGESIGPEFGDSQAQLIRPARVKEIANTLLAVDIQEKLEALSRDKAGPNDDNEEVLLGPDVLDRLKDPFLRMDAFYRDAARDGQAVLVFTEY